ncbi:coiled-coil domain-containing protein 78 isoform X3 [Pezoporus flaviventris]|uniref:coiled-coil domain-containing protein 78 isoform X3 n=1 Tax=Pezoporus flaviventris TaxID=889875 RepID=UPI002AAFD9E9|nr:coiled-coil domain-containing protein 78 isoform X3 [Pezoporus flaviventris]
MPHPLSLPCKLTLASKHMDFGIVAEKENVQLQDGDERLGWLGDLPERMGKLAGSKPDLSARMGFSEEEKLKISKGLVDLQIETNKMKEQYETENFELKNMILVLETRVLELEICNEKVTGEQDALREGLRALETSRKELADEYIILKSNYLALGKELDQEVMKNEALSRELLNLANANRSPAVAGEAFAELGRVRATVRPLSAQKVKLLGNQDNIKVELEKLKKTYDLQQQKMEERVMAMGKELQEAKCTTGDTQRKLAEQSAVLLSSQSQLQEVEAENSQLQLHLKELNEEYRSRLVQYIKDVADFMDSKSSNVMEPSKAPAAHVPMKRFVDSMLKDIRASYRAREEQLASAARGYKKRMKDLVKKHENLLIAYRLQREQIRSLDSTAADCGPAELHFSITDPELLTNTTRELNRLREDKAKLEMQLHELQKVLAVLLAFCGKSLKETSAFPLAPEQPLDEEGWAEVRKQLQEFTDTTQKDLEQERSQLLTRAIVAEEQVIELQEYIDKHLARYKQEILQLRKPHALSAGAADTHSLRRARTVRHEP